jgi:signal transduction histidine kinase/ligand-binding sensor domain-containing protein
LKRSANKKTFLPAWLFLTFSIVSPTTSVAQQYPLTYYTPNDGLINSRVRNIKQDSRGRLYFITYGGLSVYDGVRFSNYGQHEGLANELVNDVVELGPDSLLVATNTQKLNILVNGKAGPFKTVNDFCPLINRFIKSNDGNWYVASDEGLFLFADKKFTRLPFSYPVGNDIGYDLDQLIEYKNFLLIIPWRTDQRQKLILYNRQSRQITDVYTESPVVSLAQDGLGRVWVSIPEGIRLLDMGRLEKGELSLIDLPEEFNEFKNTKNIFLFFDSKKNLWIYNNSLIEKISPQLQTEIIASGRNLKAGYPLSLFEDREGIIWMSSDGNGAIKIKGTGLQFINELGTVPLQASAIEQDADTTWLFNKTNNTINRIYKKSLHSFSFSDRTFVPDHISVIGDKLFLSDAHTIRCVNNKNSPNAYQHPKLIIDMTRQGEFLGDWLVDKYGSIIQVLNKDNTSFYLIVIRDGKVIMKQPIGSVPDHLVLDESGKLWLITRDNHLMVFRVHPDQLPGYLQLLKDYSAELPLTSPRSISIDKNNNIWIGTRFSGIIKLELNGEQIHSILPLTTQNGLTDNFVYTLYCDNENNIWAGTQTGLDKIIPKNGGYSISNISRGNNFFQSIHRIVSNNSHTVWALTKEGTIFKIIATPTSAPSPPPVLINLLKVNGNLDNNTRHQFSYDQNNFLFNVAAPSFTDEKSVRYSYLLNGSANNKWSDPSGNASLNFINLAPGIYTLMVRAEFPDAMYSPQQSSLSFVILPPWWRTWWFSTCMVILLVALITLIISTYVKRKLVRQRSILEKHQAIQKERTRIAMDMHDDLGSGLSSIRFLSEKVRRNTFSDITKTDIDKIVSSTGELIDKMNEIVWAMNEKNDSLADLLTYIRSYAKEYCEENGLPCEIRLPENVPDVFVSGEIRRNIFLTIKESLHNIIKHAMASKTQIEFHINAGLAASIRDNGRGFDINETKKKSEGNGLKNMRKRIESIGGHFKIYNGQGIVIEIEIPLSI